MSIDFILKQIKVLTDMLAEERLDVEKHIINEDLIALYRAKIKHEMQERLSAE